MQAPPAAEFFGGVLERVRVAAEVAVIPGQGMMQAEKILVRGCGGGVQLCFQDDDLEPDVAAGAIKGTEDGLSGILLLGCTAADDGGEQPLSGGRVTSLADRDTGPIARVVVDCADPRAMAWFWDEAMDWTLHEVTDDHAVWRSAKGVGPYLEFLRAGVKTVPDRVHLDLVPDPGDGKAAEVAGLRALGATDLDLGQGDVPWTCLADPEGHEFCVLARS